MMGYIWDGNSFVRVSTDESSVDFVFRSRESVINIEPITIDISIFEWNFFTDVRILSSKIIRTRVVGWFIGISPSFEE